MTLLSFELNMLLKWWDWHDSETGKLSSTYSKMLRQCLDSRWLLENEECITQRRYDHDITFTCNHSYMRHQCMLLVRVCVVIVATCPYCWPPLNLEMQSCSHLIYTASFTRTLPQTLLSWNISTHVLMNQWWSHTIFKITTLNMSRRQFFAGNITENL